MAEGTEFLDHLRALAIDGVLPAWGTWWGGGVMEALVPDVDRRVALESEMVEVPLAFFESTFDAPEGWCEGPGGYLLLSEPYREDAERARARRWSTVERLGGHLDIVNDPGPIASTIVQLVRGSDVERRSQ